jgi:hypothetical protein
LFAHRSVAALAKKRRRSSGRCANISLFNHRSVEMAEGADIPPYPLPSVCS